MKQKSFKLISGIKGKEVLGGKPRNRKHFYHFYLGFGFLIFKLICILSYAFDTQFGYSILV